jgi:hypothetical protein
MAKGHTVYRASCCVPCVKWLNGNGKGNNQWYYNQLVLERMVWQLVVNGSMGKQKLAERV